MPAKYLPHLIGTIIACMVLQSASVVASEQSLEELIAGIPAEQLEKLQSADFMTVRDLTANLPHGSLTIKRGVIASYKGHDQQTAGIVIGEVEMLLDRLPVGGYNAFPSEIFDQNGVFRATVTQSFLYASVNSEAYLKEVGFVAALRKWDALKPAEQRQFLEVLAQAWPGIWRDQEAESKQRRPVLRNPVGGEVYGAAWVKGWPGSEDQLTRIDMWVEADGKTTRGIEHSTGELLAQFPWPEEKEAVATRPSELP
jgi:hypothetical protein